MGPPEPSSSSSAPSAPDCPICLDAMAPGDVRHPLQCSTGGCGYNFCLSCIESLISSSRDDYLEASDGNRHVKVFLHCPQCRSDLGPTIRDTALLRRADALEDAVSGGNDSELSASELRMRNAMEDPDVRGAVEEARKREAEFLGRDGRADDLGEGGGGDVSRADSGISASSAESASEKKEADATLFGGYEFCMTSDEQRVVTEMMTSGSVTKLSAAALFLSDVVRMSREGKTAASREKESMSSVMVLIDESKVAKEKAALKAAGATAQTAAKLAAAPGQRGMRAGMATKSDHRNYERELKRKQEYMRTHPLPVRMPKYVELTLQSPGTKHFPLTFVDDTWDGTVSDAFSKITVSSRGKVDKKKTENVGVWHVLKGGSNGKAVIDRIRPATPRVLVSSVKAEGGKKGVMKGDVVTHLNGEDFGGTAEELNAAIQSEVNRGDSPTFSLVLNAERSTAEALRRRALVK